MDAFPWDLVGLAVILAANRVLIPMVATRTRWFWAVQVVDLALAAGVAVAGLPGLAGFAGVRWLVSALLVFHVVQNLAVRGKAIREKERIEEEKERMRILRELREPPPGDNP